MYLAFVSSSLADSSLDDPESLLELELEPLEPDESLLPEPEPTRSASIISSGILIMANYGMVDEKYG